MTPLFCKDIFPHERQENMTMLWVRWTGDIVVAENIFVFLRTQD